MDKQFDELSKSLAQGVTRKEALRKFAFGVVGVVIAVLGFSRKAEATLSNHCILDPTGRMETGYCGGITRTCVRPYGFWSKDCVKGRQGTPAGEWSCGFLRWVYIDQVPCS